MLLTRRRLRDPVLPPCTKESLGLVQNNFFLKLLTEGEEVFTVPPPATTCDDTHDGTNRNERIRKTGERESTNS